MNNEVLMKGEGATDITAFGGWRAYLASSGKGE